MMTDKQKQAELWKSHHMELQNPPRTYMDIMCRTDYNKLITAYDEWLRRKLRHALGQAWSQSKLSAGITMEALEAIADIIDTAGKEKE